MAFRRTDEGFVREIYEGSLATIALPEIAVELPLASIYDSVNFEPELEADDDE